MASPNLPWTPNFEPKREHKFILELQNIDIFYITDVSIPKATIASEAKHNFLSHIFKFPGKLTWGDSQFKLVDAIDKNAANLFIKHLKGSGYVFPSSFNVEDQASLTYYLKTIKKSFDANLLQNMTIKSLDSFGTPNEAWTLKNTFIKDIDFGSYKYDADGLKNITVSVSCDWVDYVSFRSSDVNVDTTAKDV